MFLTGCYHLIPHHELVILRSGKIDKRNANNKCETCKTRFGFLYAKTPSTRRTVLRAHLPVESKHRLVSYGNKYVSSNNRCRAQIGHSP